MKSEIHTGFNFQILRSYASTSTTFVVVVVNSGKISALKYDKLYSLYFLLFQISYSYQGK